MLKNNINHNKKSNTMRMITKSNTKKKMENTNTNKKTLEDKEKTDLNTIGIKNKSLSKLKYHKHPRKFSPNLMDKNSKINSLSLKN